MADDATLASLVRRLAAMSDRDRAAVMATLSDAEAADLDRLTRTLTAGAMSQPLRDLIAEGLDGVTPRAAAAIRAAALSQASEPAPASAGVPGASLWQRVTAAVFGRA